MGKKIIELFFFKNGDRIFFFFEITMIELKIIIKFPILNNNKVD